LTGSYNSAFFNYSIFDNSNARAGIIVAAWNGNNINFNETTTADIGNTSDVFFNVNLSNEGHVQFKVNTNSSWTFKTITTFL